MQSLSASVEAESISESTAAGFVMRRTRMLDSIIISQKMFMLNIYAKSGEKSTIFGVKFEKGT